MTDAEKTRRIDRFMPEFDVSEYHATLVDATPKRTFAAIRAADLAESWIVRTLLSLRGMRAVDRVTIESATFEGFSIVDEDPPYELVIAVEGKFWSLRCPPRAVTREEPQAPGTARAAWNFVVVPLRDRVLLSTETRVRCADRATFRKFRVYWFFVRPFSGLIRRFMLRAIRAEAERT